MNKFFKLLYVNILALLDINKIKKAREDGVKSNLEVKSIITVIIALFYGYILYKLFITINITNVVNILVLGFVLSSGICLITDINLIEPIMFKGEDNEMLFSLPLSKYQVVFSKLFTIYLRNLIYVAIIMFAAMMGYIYYVKEISENLGMMYVLSSLFIPFIPMVIASIIAYINSYVKVKFINNKIYYYILKYLILGLLCLILFMVFKNVRVSNINELIDIILSKLNIIYPLNFFFYLMVRDENVLFFVLLMIIPILILYIYSFFLSNNYLKISSMLKGVKRKVVFKYKKTLNLHKIGGIVRKELINLFKNKFYLVSTLTMVLIFSIGLFIGLRIVNTSELYKIKNFEVYLNLYCPTILSMFVTFNVMSISIMSLEKDNIEILRTLPLGMRHILYSKWLCSVLVNSIFIIINALIIYFNLSKNISLLIFNLLVPLFALMFVSLTSLLLDYRFICKKETNDNVIIKQRLITLVPMFLALVIGIAPFFLPPYLKYKLLLSSYILLFIILMLIEVLYMVIKRKKLIKGLC